MHPTAVLGAASSPPLGQDELAIVGGLRGAPVQLVPGVTVPIDVPAEAEFVIEGYIRNGVRAPEGPFGDFLHYYVPVMNNHRLRVTAITHRADAIYRTMHAGSAEDVQVLGLSREVDIRQAVEATGARVAAVRLNPTIRGAVVAIDRRYCGEGKSAAMAALAAYRWLKYCVVVDPDVDVDDSADVWWAVATRTALDQDVVVVPASGGFPRDEGGMHDAKLIVDATAPVGGTADFRRRVPPGDGRLRLEDFVSEGRVPDPAPDRHTA
jgi:2,5-furandicarboxylate decarboxylase 1